MKRVIWSFEPDKDVAEMVTKAIRSKAGSRKANQRGWKSRLLNESLRHLLGGATKTSA